MKYLKNFENSDFIRNSDNEQSIFTVSDFIKVKYLRSIRTNI